MITCQLLQFLLEFIDLVRVLVLAVLLLPVNANIETIAS